MGLPLVTLSYGFTLNLYVSLLLIIAGDCEAGLVAADVDSGEGYTAGPTRQGYTVQGSHGVRQNRRIRDSNHSENPLNKAGPIDLLRIIL